MFILVKVSAIMPVTATHIDIFINSMATLDFTCLGHLGWHDKK
jgi:hypothetical protein